MTKARNATQLAMRRILVTLLSLGIVVGMASTVQAQESTPTDSPLGFGIRPAQTSDDDPESLGYFTHSLEPGTELFDEAVVLNEGDLPVHLQVYVAEAMTAINGGTAFGHRNDNPSGEVDWIQLDVEEISLQPGETQIVPFTIAVPADAAPGDHLVGLLVEQVRAETDSGDTSEDLQFAVEVVQRVGVAVVIEVAGDRVAQLGITDLRLGEQYEQGAVFEVAVHNTGNVMVNGHGDLTVTDLEGSELAEITFDMDTVLAGEITFFYIDHPVLLADGNYLLHAKVEYQALRGDETIQTTALGNIALQVVNGQPRPSGIENQQPPAPVTITGSASLQAEGPAALQADRAQRTIVLYAILTAFALTVAAAFVWPRSRKQPTPRDVLTGTATDRPSAAPSGTGPTPTRPTQGPGRDRPAASSPSRGLRRKSQFRLGRRRR